MWIFLVILLACLVLFFFGISVAAVKFLIWVALVVALIAAIVRIIQWLTDRNRV